MTDEKFDKRLTAIKKVIQEEKQSAIEDFRKKDFLSLLDEKIKVRAKPKPKPKHTFPWWSRKPLPIIVSLFLIFIIGIFLRNIFVPSAYEKNLKAFEDLLVRATHAQRIFQAKESQFPIVSPGNEAFFRFEWAMKRVLFGLHRKNIPDEEIPFLFYEVLSMVTGNRGDRLVIYEEKESVLSGLEQGINKLRKEQNCRQLFSQVLKKLQEA